MFIHREGRQAV